MAPPRPLFEVTGKRYLLDSMRGTWAAVSRRRLFGGGGAGEEQFVGVRIRGPLAPKNRYVVVVERGGRTIALRFSELWQWRAGAAVRARARKQTTPRRAPCE